MIIRDARPSDLPALLELQIASWRSAYAGILPEAYLGSPVARDLTRKWQALPEEPDFTLVAVEDDRPLGLLVMRMAGRERPYLDNLHVAPAAKGQGCGRLMMTSAARRLLHLGQDRMELTVLEENAAARGVYARLGGFEGTPFADILFGLAVTSVPVIWTDLPALAARVAVPCPGPHGEKPSATEKT
ncbi:ribosomal protein S18 acetylase RimI-like enzyme [Aliiruegeria haliotis]|uniref:Ribosomal protein S18 acetylase RimI-like enzyme n=1 Tax=Aliiruegeria haliotis TaxID=1280846 RepID=A0A2T0RZA0_9RHOB|nr:GNAT family N-acetyltransferase [Aliiruegeria haliotis]PRY26504.1 ribosomal protein S18 acetylase RimI-like enzyme [Aliiruegeria haliotis]